MPIFKPKQTPREVAEGLFMWVFHSENVPESVKTLAEEFRAYSPVEYSTLYREYVHFRMFVTDWVLDAAEHQKERKQVREDFNLLVVLMAKQQPRPEETLREIKEHLSAYTAAANSEHRLGVPFAVATTFCELCGDRGPTKDSALVTTMTLEFAALVKVVAETLRKGHIA
jgi:hypothetical protein